jgi:ribosomal protein S18 acetylase RimI-like enzyme
VTSSSSSLPVTFRDLAPEDLSDLDWSGGSMHLESLARELEGASAGNSVLLVGVLPNGRVVALGGADFRSSAQLGVLWMLVVHETLQSLGIGSRLITELEQRVRDHGARAVRLEVEHDNPAQPRCIGGWAIASLAANCRAGP